MSGRTSTRPAARPPAKPELSVQEIRALLEAPTQAPERYAEARVVWASAWAICRPHGARVEVIDVAETLSEAHALARQHPDAVAMLRSIRLVQIVEDF